MFTTIGVMSAWTVTSHAAPEQLLGSAPTMLKPYVTPLFGSRAEPHQCATVREVGKAWAPPSVAVSALSESSLMTWGSADDPLGDLASVADAVPVIRRPSIAAPVARRSPTPGPMRVRSASIEPPQMSRVASGRGAPQSRRFSLGIGEPLGARC